MSSFDAAAAARRYAEEETDELIRIAFLESREYLPAAVALAREELKRRGVEGGADTRVEVAREAHAVQEKVADAPLAGGLKVVCFVLPLAVGVIIALVHDNRGKKRASRQAWACTGWGWLARTTLIVGVLVAAT